MPLPYPSALKPRDCIPEVDKKAVSFEKSLNLAVLVLNWLHLRRPSVAPLEVVIGTPLSKVQWRVVRHLEFVMAGCKEASPISAHEMGRTAAKMEDIETFIGKLQQFETAAHSYLDSHFGKNFGSFSHLSRPRSRSFAPGLQRVPPGEILGTLSGATQMTAKIIESDRLNFRGEPCFDPSGFLDRRGREVFQRPVQNAMKPEESLEEPPRVKIHCNRHEKMKLFRKLDEGGRLGMVSEEEVYAGYQAGLFSVMKDAGADRLIFDSRPFNQLERPMGRWVKGMASINPLLDIQLLEDEICLVHSTDLRDFYYAFKISGEREARNSLVGAVSPSDFEDFKCFRKDLTGKKRVFLSLRTLAMGDSLAVEIAQTAHLGILVQAGLLGRDTLISNELSVPRSSFFGGVVIDDLVFFERMLRHEFEALGEEDGYGCSVMKAALSEYHRVGLLPHPKKTFLNSTQSEFWGCDFNGISGRVHANLKRLIPVMAVTHSIINLGLCSVGLLEVIVGCWTSIFLFRRRLLSLMNLVYQVCQGEVGRRHVIRLSEELKEELFLLLALGPLAVTCIRLPNSPYLYCSDASDWGIGITKACLPTWLQSEIHRHKMKKGVWAKLLSPLKSLQRLKGCLPAGDELPGGLQLASHPLWIELATALPFKEVLRQKERAGIHINISELRAMIRVEKEAAKDFFPQRFFSLADSQVSVGVWIKGRSSSYGLNQELQQSLAIHIGCGMFGNTGYIPSEVNTSDDPTRGCSVRGPQKELASALKVAEKGDLKPFDEWLEKYGASPYDCSGLPPLEELEKEDDYSSFAVGRVSHHRNEVKNRLSKKKARKVKRPETKHAMPEVLEPQKVAAPELSERVSDEQTRVSKCTLSARAKELLRLVPSDQFVLPKGQKLKPGEIPTGKGFLDLYSGVKGVARAIAELGNCWSITFEIEDGANQDVLSAWNRWLIEELLKSGCILGLGIAIFCSSFSRAVRPPVRTAEEPWGIASLSGKMLAKVEHGNRHARYVADLITLAKSLNIHFWLENPDGSFIWLLSIFVTLGSQNPACSCRLDYCTMGTAWRKRTRILTSTHLAGQTFWCSRLHTHIPLKGWCKSKKAPWTRVAQSYPKRLCHIIAQALLVDCGVLPERKHVCLARLSRCEHCRIGEASHPGPRRPRRTGRNPLELEGVLLVEPQTAVLGNSVWEAFNRWASEHFSPKAVDSLLSCPATLGVLISAFGKHIFEQGQSIYLLRQLITHVQRENPMTRPHLQSCWQLVSKWEIIEPTVHRTPLPLVIFRAMMSLSIGWGWLRTAGIIALTFFGICRPGETLSGLREDLLLPSDLVAEDASQVFFKIRNPKGRRRGLGRVQHSKISDLSIANFLQKVFGQLRKDDPLFPGSPASFRRRWDLLLQHLSIPISLGLTPASMRAGGAISAYRSGIGIADLMWRMRLKQVETLHHYLQELGAESVFIQLSSRSKKSVVAASALYEAFLHFSLDGVST